MHVDDLAAAARDFLRWLEDLGRSRRTVTAARHVLTRFARAVTGMGVGTLFDLGPNVVLRHAAGILTRELAPKTLDDEVQTIRRFTRWLHEEGRTLGDAGAALPRSRRLPRPIPKRVLGEGQVERLFRATGGDDPSRQRDRALLEVLYSAGARRGEAAALEVTDLDLAEGMLAIRKGKGDRARIVPLPPKTSATLARYVREARPLLLLRSTHDRGALLLRDGGRPLRARDVPKVLRDVALRARVRVVAPHALRHAIATHLVRAGVSIRLVQLFLGHAHIDTTAIYSHLAQRDLRAVLERAHPREREPALANARRR